MEPGKPVGVVGPIAQELIIPEEFTVAGTGSSTDRIRCPPRENGKFPGAAMRI